MSIPGFTAETTVGESADGESEGAKRVRHRISVPGLISDEVGLGDVIARIASAAGIPSCGSCRRRAQALNAWLSFVPRR